MGKIHPCQKENIKRENKMAQRIKRKVGSCEITETVINGRRTFKCRNLKRAPTAQEVINSIKSRKIKYG